LGQSWMQGGNRDRADPLATPSSEHPNFALQLNAPTRPQADYLPGLRDLHEKEGGDRTRERPLSGCADSFLRALLAHTGRRHPLLTITAARGGSTLAGGLIPDDGLLPGSMIYDWMLAQVGYAAELLKRQGKRLVVLSILAAHGETDAQLNAEGEAFAKGWRRIRREADAAIGALTGQKRPVLLHTYQTTGLNRRFRQSERCDAAQVAWWQLRIADADPLCRCVGPVYWTTAGADDLAHVTNRSLRRVGLQFGRYVFDDVFARPRRPLRIVGLLWIGPERLRVTYEREIVVEDDDRRVNVSSLGPGKGFELEFPKIEAKPRILGIEPSDANRCALELILDRPAPSNHGRLLVATRQTGPGIGRETGGRAAVRSREPLDQDPQDGFVLHDWACIEAMDLPAPP
ncbi:MAG: hypothetical protein M3Y22_17330, partial [Pseudomonadota bacterium]|nr:hypothetical protein [Pseudomonadota bacterium]